MKQCEKCIALEAALASANDIIEKQRKDLDVVHTALDETNKLVKHWQGEFEAMARKSTYYQNGMIHWQTKYDEDLEMERKQAGDIIAAVRGLEPLSHQLNDVIISARAYHVDIDTESDFEEQERAEEWQQDSVVWQGSEVAK